MAVVYMSIKAKAEDLINKTLELEPEEACELMYRETKDYNLRNAVALNIKWIDWVKKFEAFMNSDAYLIMVNKIENEIAETAFINAFNRIQKITNIDGKTLEQRALKTCEEAGEVCGAVLGYVKAPGSEYKNKTLEDVIEENADTFICVMSLLAHAAPDMTIEEFMNVVNSKMDKWESKVKG